MMLFQDERMRMMAKEAAVRAGLGKRSEDELVQAWLFSGIPDMQSHQNLTRWDHGPYKLCLCDCLHATCGQPSLVDPLWGPCLSMRVFHTLSRC
jgi:hypothetical protein